MLAWHWVRDDCTLRDGRPLVWYEKLQHTEKLVMCESGYHASKKILDALHYAKGSVCCRVNLGGEMIKDSDKIVARERTVLWAIDADQTLREFSRWCALQVIHLWDAPDVVRRYLETGDYSIRAAARDAAQDATWATRAASWNAWAAARDATRAATRDATRDATWATWAAARATRAAARDATWDATWATWAVARATRDTTRDTTRDAWAAARDAQNAKLEEMVEAHWVSQWEE